MRRGELNELLDVYTITKDRINRQVTVGTFSGQIYGRIYYQNARVDFGSDKLMTVRQMRLLTEDELTTSQAVKQTTGNEKLYQVVCGKIEYRDDRNIYIYEVVEIDATI